MYIKRLLWKFFEEIWGQLLLVIAQLCFGPRDVDLTTAVFNCPMHRPQNTAVVDFWITRELQA